MKVRLATEEEVRRVLLDPEIYDRISNDTCPPVDAQIPLPPCVLYLGGYLGDKIVALYTLHWVGHYRMHFMVLKSNRGYARSLISKFLAATSYFRPLTIEIPSLYPSVIAFARYTGFQTVTVRPADYPKGGRDYDTHVMVLET